MDRIIIYGSCYGTAKLYAEALSEKTGIKAVSYDRISGLDRYETIVYVGGLYAGGVRGMGKNCEKDPGGYMLQVYRSHGRACRPGG